MEAFIDILGNKISEVGILYIPSNDLDVFQYVLLSEHVIFFSLNDSITVIRKHLKMQSKVRLNWCFDRHKVRVHFMSYEISPKYDTEMFLLGIAIVLENCF